jgi:hypothetical protein
MSKTERNLVRWGLILVGTEGLFLAGEELGGRSIGPRRRWSNSMSRPRPR